MRLAALLAALLTTPVKAPRFSPLADRGDLRLAVEEDDRRRMFEFGMLSTGFEILFATAIVHTR
jgi:hypothetical protein